MSILCKKMHKNEAGGSLKTSYGLRGPCLLPQALFFGSFWHFLDFEGANRCKKVGVETPTKRRSTLKAFGWSNFQVKSRKLKVILVV